MKRTPQTSWAEPLPGGGLIYWVRRPKTRYSTIEFDLISAPWRVSRPGLEAIRQLALAHGYAGSAVLSSTVAYLARVPIAATAAVFEGIRAIVLDPRYHCSTSEGGGGHWTAAAFRRGVPS